MNMVFIDTWAWYALVDTTDNDHAVAQLALEELLNDAYTFVTTNFVIAETITLIRYNLNHQAAVEFYDRLNNSLLMSLLNLYGSKRRMKAALGRFLKSTKIRIFLTWIALHSR